MPKLGATFIPGGYDDDYFMPEVIAPSPQRVMPEVPQNMQDGLHRMELEASQPSLPATSDSYNINSSIGKSTFAAATSAAAPPPPSSGTGATVTKSTGSAGVGAPVALSDPSGQPPRSTDEFKPFSAENQRDMGTFDAPSFSPFPRVKGDNVPPSDEEKEEILYNARHHVLNSNNVSMQLVWARDSLSWVEVAAEAHMRESKDQGTRPKTPKIEHELRVDAINIVDYLAAQGHPEALFMRSKWLEFGRFGFRIDKKEAYLGYKRAAEQGWGRAEYRMGMLFEGSNDMEKALMHYNQGVALKDSAASYRLGMMSLLGQHGYRKDYQRGLDLIHGAADTSDEDAPQGAFVYGMLVARELPDINIPEGMLAINVSLARQYVEKAAYLGFGKAQLKMGQAYELCQLGCDFNPALSLHYYGLAARQGQAEAALGVSRWFLFGHEGVILKNESLAFQYAQQAADAKVAAGEFAVGYYYEIGIHVQKDIREARSWYERAAEHGNTDAVARLEALDQAKTLTKRDHETTALTRIKSRYGSQRGQRPDRFGNRQKDTAAVAVPALPTLDEAAAHSSFGSDIPPVQSYAVGAGGDGLSAKTPVAAGRPSSVSPRQRPSAEGLTAGGGGRLPAFSISLDTSGLALRPKSTAPYPDDDKPAPLNISRPKSTAPYPDDDAPDRPPLSPHYNPQIRPSNGPQASRPLSAFGIRPFGDAPSQGGLRPIAGSQTASNLAPDLHQQQQQRPYSTSYSGGRPVVADPGRGRIVSAGWEPQVPSGYRGSSPSGRVGGGAGRSDYRTSLDPSYGQQYQAPQQPQQQPAPGQGLGQGPPNSISSGSLPAPENSRNRLSKANPNISVGGDGGGQLQAGRDYGPRASSRPASYAGGNVRDDRSGSVSGQGGGVVGGRFPGGGGPMGRMAAEHSGRQSAPPMQDHPGFGGGHGGPAAVGRPVSAVQPRIPSMSPPRQSGGPGRPPAQPAKPAASQGPATFEEMGIPQGKSDDNCRIM